MSSLQGSSEPSSGLDDDEQVPLEDEQEPALQDGEEAPPPPERMDYDVFRHINPDEDIYYMICIGANEEGDIYEAWSKNVWASTMRRRARDNTPPNKIVSEANGIKYRIGGHRKLVNKYKKYCLESDPPKRIVLLFTVYNEDGCPQPRPLLGVAVMKGLPDPDLVGLPKWQHPERYDRTPFPIEWIFKNNPRLAEAPRQVIAWPDLPQKLHLRDVVKVRSRELVYSFIVRCISFKNTRDAVRHMILTNKDAVARLYSGAKAAATHDPERLEDLVSPEDLVYRPEDIEDAAKRVMPDDEDEIIKHTVREFKESGVAGLKRRKKQDVEYEEDVAQLNKRHRDNAPLEKSKGDAPMFDWSKLEPPFPPPEYAMPNLTDLSFCVIDIDYTEMPSLNPRRNFPREFDQIDSNNTPVLRAYGVTREGYSVTGMIRGFLPYIHTRVSPDFFRQMRYDKTKYTQAELDKHPEVVAQIINASQHISMCNFFRMHLNKDLQSKLNKSEAGKYPQNNLVWRVNLERMQSIDGYTNHYDWFLRITFCTPKLVVRARDILMSGKFLWAGQDRSRAWKYPVFEANVPFALRFMVDASLMGGSWVTVKKDNYTRWDSPKDNDTFSDIEFNALWTDIIAHAPDDPAWSDPPPVRKLTFDIECAGKDGRFPIPVEYDEKDKPIRGSGDPVICIAARVTEQTRGKDQKLIGDVIFTWGRCNQSKLAGMMCYYKKRGIDEPFTREFFEKQRVGINKAQDGSGHYYWAREDEADMLQAFREFIIQVARPHVISGYNVNGFDFPYLIDRAKSVGLDEKFDILGWSKTDRTRVREKIFSSKAYGNRKVKEFAIGGRVMMDALTIILRDYKLRSYTLNAVAEHFFKDKEGNATERKADVTHDQIGPLWNSSNEDRRKVAEYCWKDVDIAHKLDEKVLMFLDKLEMCRATGVPFSYIITRGQQIKVMSLLLRYAKAKQFVVPTNNEVDKDAINMSQEKYKGATVIDPRPGFYDDIVATLDFSALYPSIMRRKNMCFTTRISPEDAKNWKITDLYVTETETGPVYFVRESVKMGLLPAILEALTAKRNAAKGEMKKYAGKEMEKVYDKRQNALKVTSNSVYGFTGAAAGGMMPCPDIAKAVTGTGRVGIELTARMVEKPYSEIPREDGEEAEAYAERCKKIRESYPIPKEQGETDEQHAERIAKSVEIIYGDTDSVMVRMIGNKDLKKGIDLGYKYAKWISANFFKKPMEILFEKVYFPYLLVAKKRYAGLFWTKPDAYDKKDVKGMESVRRDNCLLVKNTIDQMISTILIDKDISKMVNILVEKVESVARETVDLADLVISKSLSKEPKDYYPTPPQAQVALNMAKENPATAPKMGDRVPYIVTGYGGKKEKTSKKAEHPIKVIKYGIPVDKSYYIDRQLRKPCERIIEPLMPGITAKIFSQYSSTVYIPTSSDQFVRKADTPAPVLTKKPAPLKKRGKNDPKGLFNGEPTRSRKLPEILAGQKTIEGQFLKPVERKITDKKEGLTEIKIDHVVRISRPSMHKGSLGSHVLIVPKCLYCQKSMAKHAGQEEDAPAFCDDCAATYKEPVPLEDLPLMNKLHKEHVDKLWDICLKCQDVKDVESLRECGTWECPNFFKRTSAKSTLRRIETKLRRFEVYLEERQNRSASMMVESYA